MYRKTAEELADFLRSCPGVFHTVDRIGKELEANGYERLRECDRWEIQPGGRYYTTRNGSSLIAFHTGSDPDGYGFHIAASHSDFPTFKIKENAELEVKKQYIQLNTEGYGGMLCSTWFDRPLSVAGRLIIKEGDHFTSKLLNVDRDLVLIPSVAIHMNRTANEGTACNKQVDMLPLFGGADGRHGDLKRLIAKEAGVSEDSVYGSDLYLYNRQQPFVWGGQKEFISAPHLDDLQCAWAALRGFLAGHHEKTVQVYACFDNEEVGSGTKQGAGSTFLYDVLRRIHKGLGQTEEDYYRAVARSFMVSADNAHAVHPNHPEKSDPENGVYMNAGIVIKSHAGQKYTSDGASIALFRDLCEKAGVPVQYYANRSDMQSGSTLGNISSAQVSLNTVDIGLAQLAMHSSCETAGVKDTFYMVQAMTQFYSSDIGCQTVY